MAVEKTEFLKIQVGTAAPACNTRVGTAAPGCAAGRSPAQESGELRSPGQPRAAVPTQLPRAAVPRQLPRAAVPTQGSAAFTH